jgi:hypothetical protein
MQRKEREEEQRRIAMINAGIVSDKGEDLLSMEDDDDSEHERGLEQKDEDDQAERLPGRKSPKVLLDGSLHQED